MKTLWDLLSGLHFWYFEVRVVNTILSCLSYFCFLTMNFGGSLRKKRLALQTEWYEHFLYRAPIVKYNSAI